jgi:hypothetical protein
VKVERRPNLIGTKASAVQADTIRRDAFV